MDRIGQYYVYFLLAVSALTALVRLTATRLYAQLESDRLRTPKARRNRLWIGGAVMALSPAILLYRFWGPVHPWMWLTIALGVLGGAEQFTAAAYSDFRRLLWHTRVFGMLSAATTVVIYVFFVRR